MNWTESLPQYGDIIRVKVNFYYHYGIFVDEQNVIQFGMPDNRDTPADEIAIMCVDINAFSYGGFVERGEPDRNEQKRRYSPEQTVKNALSRLGEKGYNILNNNCEHFANECYFGEKKSFIDDVRAKIRQKLGNLA